MRRCADLLLRSLAALLLSGGAALAEMENADAAREALKKSQAAIGREVGDHRFIDVKGRPVTLKQHRGKPLVLSLVYSSCYRTCPAITESLAKAVGQARSAIGDDSFAVLTIGFDTSKDTPEAMRQFAKSHGADIKDWTYAAGDPVSVAQLAEETGFTFYPSPRGFDHLTQTTLIDKDGRIATQIYGDNFDSPLLVEPLKALIWGRAASLNSVDGIWNRVKIFCTVYDPAADRYRFDFSLFIETFMGATSVLFAAFYLHRLRKNVRA
jgi:protein SCO1/2